MTTSTAITRGIQVDVRADFVPDQSDPAQHQWFFAYQITISNRSGSTVQLLSREWVITDAQGRVEIVRGPGVVGHQPSLRPREGFQYTSGCPLPTAFGSMKGKYTMIDESGEQFQVDVAEFALCEPMAIN